MTYLTPPEARQRACPVARVSVVPADKDGNVVSECRADKCMWWRWKAIMADDHRFLSAVARETSAIEDERRADPEKKHKKQAHSLAAERVCSNIDGYVVRGDTDKGYCGAAGRPE